MLLSREYASLLDEDGAQQFAHKVVQKLAGVQVSSSLSVTADGLVGFALTVHSLTAPTSCSYSALAEALRSTALDTLPKRDRRQSGWFEANVDTLCPLIAARNVALGSFLSQKHLSPLPSVLAHVRLCRLRFVRQNLCGFSKSAP